MAEPHKSRVYSDFARYYDSVFGRVFIDREHEIIGDLNLRPDQNVLEVGVGTGISLDAYPAYTHVIAIDPSADMLKIAERKIAEQGLTHVEVRQGDALNLEFPDNTFDFVTSFHVMTVVPDPVRMMAEMIRVCKVGGRIVVETHFQSDNPIVALLNNLVNPITRLIGWTTRVRKSDVLRGHKIELEHNARTSQFSVHTLIIARKLA